MTQPDPIIPPAQVRFFPPAGVSLILATGVVWAGRTVRDEEITEGLVVAGAFVVIVIAVINVISPGLAAAFAGLIFIATVLAYGLDILTSIGLATQEG
jgi:hypothetical protein